MRRAMLLILALSSFADSVLADQSRFYAYTWTPRSTDVGPPGSKDYLLLEALLFLSKPVTFP